MQNGCREVDVGMIEAHHGVPPAVTTFPHEQSATTAFLVRS
jgi:hypothetical protein